MATVTVPTVTATTPRCERVKIATERSGDRATTTVYLEGNRGWRRVGFVQHSTLWAAEVLRDNGVSRYRTTWYSWPGQPGMIAGELPTRLDATVRKLVAQQRDAVRAQRAEDLAELRTGPGCSVKVVDTAEGCTVWGAGLPTMPTMPRRWAARAVELLSACSSWGAQLEEAYRIAQAVEATRPAPCS